MRSIPVESINIEVAQLNAALARQNTNVRVAIVRECDAKGVPMATTSELRVVPFWVEPMEIP